MYTKTPMFSNLMAQPSRTLSARGLITYPDTSTDSLTSAEIVSLVVHENAGEHLPLGGVSASTLTLRLDNRQGEWNSKDFDGAIINLEIGIYHPNYSATPLTVDGDAPDTEYEESADGGAPDTVYTDTIDGGAPETFPAETYWAKIGTFVTESAIGQEQSTTIEIKGADYLGNYAQKEFTDGQTYPRTVLQILQYACAQAGITLDTTTFINSAVSIATKPAWEENTTCRDVIGFVACLACGFARIDRDGLLEIVAFDGNPDYTITTARYRNFERQGAIFGPFNALSVYEFGAPNNYGATRIADDIDMVDNELNSIAVQGNPLLKYGSSSTLMTNMLSGLSGLTFTGAKIDWQGDPALTNGDVVTLTDLDSVAVVVLILNQTLTLDSGFSMSSGNSLKSVIKGKAKTEYMRVFTPTGKLNAAALDGDINIRAGRQLNLLAGSDIKVKSGANIDIAAGGKINIASSDGIVLSSGSGLDSALGGKLGANQPSAGVQTSKITIDSDSIDIASGGGVNISSGADMTISAGGNFNLGAGTGKSGIGMSNDRPDDAFIWAGSDNPANAPFRVTMDGELTAASIGGNLIIPIANGGTGYNRQTIHRGTDYPSSGFGQDGDLFIFHNGQADSSWSAQTLAYGAAGQNTYFGVNRNWNQVPTSGFYRFGNGVGSSDYDWGAYAYFTAPDAVNSLTFTFNTAKYFNSTWYGYSGTTTYKVVLVKASNMAVILASTTCYANQNQNTQTVTLTTSSNLTQGDTYYLAVFFDGSDEKTNAGIVGSITMQGKVSNSRTFDLLLKSAGQWQALFGNG